MQAGSADIMGATLMSIGSSDRQRRHAAQALGVGLVVALMLAPAASPRAQDTTSGWATGVQSGPAPKGAAPPKDQGAGNLTVVPRTQTDISGSVTSLIQLVGLLTEDGQPIDRGVVWRVYSEKGAAAGRPRLMSTHREASPLVRLAPGDYLVNVTFGRAHLTRKVVVKAGPQATENFVLNAGGLRVRATLQGAGDLPDKAAAYDIFAGQRDQSGERPLVISAVRPGLIVRLNAGVYHIVSVYGDANAVLRADITVEAGKLTETVVSHSGARVSFRLLNRAGGEVLPDTRWAIHGAQGELVKESVGALSAHVLAPGRYVVNARHGDQVFRREFAVQGNDPLQVEVIAQ